MPTTKVLPFQHEAFVNPFKLVSANDSSLFQEPSSFGSAYLKKVKATNFQKETSSLDRASNAWKVAMGISIVATATFLPLSISALSHLWFSFSIKNLLCTTLCILGFAQGAKSIPFCAEKGPECASQVKYITKVLEWKKQLDEDPSLLQKKYQEFGITPNLFDTHQEEVKLLLAELLHKKNLIQDEEKRYTDFASNPKHKLNPEFDRFNAHQRIAALEAWRTCFLSLKDIQNSITLRKVEAAALLAFIKNPQGALPKAHFFSSKIIDSMFFLHSETKNAETTLTTENVLNQKIEMLALNFT